MFYNLHYDEHIALPFKCRKGGNIKPVYESLLLEVSAREMIPYLSNYVLSVAGEREVTVY